VELNSERSRVVVKIVHCSLCPLDLIYRGTPVPMAARLNGQGKPGTAERYSIPRPCSSSENSREDGILGTSHSTARSKRRGLQSKSVAGCALITHPVLTELNGASSCYFVKQIACTTKVDRVGGGAR